MPATAPTASPRWYQDSYAPLAYDVLYSQKGETDADFTRFPFTDFFQSLTITRKTSNIWTGTLTLFDRDEKFLCGPKRPGMNSRFRIKWWWANRINEEFYAPMYSARVIKITPAYSPEGTGLAIEMSGELTAKASFNKDMHPRSWPAGILYSKIVSQICSAQGWPISALEPSFNKTDKPLMMGGESHQEFILNKILPLAFNKNHQHFQFYFDDDDKTRGVHFHTPSYLFLNGLATNARSLAREYVSYADMVGEVESFTPSDNTLFQVLQGAGDGTHESVNSDKGVPFQQKSKIEEGIKNIQTNKPLVPPSTSDESNVSNVRTPVAGSPGLGTSDNPTPTQSSIGWVARTKDEANGLAINLFSRLRAAMVTADMQVKGTHGISPNDYIGVRYFVYSGKEHYLSGVYRVNSLTHNLGASGWSTQFNLFRNGSKPDTAEKQINVPYANSTKIDFVPPSLTGNH